jgi:hypothetical protein
LQTLRPAQDSATTENASAVLLRDLIDYAGLFPPASLAMGRSVANYQSYSQSEWSWILGRFIVPAARLGEFEAAFTTLADQAPEASFARWRLSALLGTEVIADVARIHDFNARMANGVSGKSAVVQSVELKVANVDEIKRLSEIIPRELDTYFELPWSSNSACITAIADCGRRAKMRTGGETADKFPAAESVIEFIRRCAAANVPFKATAGLHHPLRAVHRLTYQPDSPSAMMHGFINVFLVAAFLRTGMSANLAMQLLEEQSPEAFQFHSEAIEWRQYKLTRDEITATRREFAVSFGSCSFMEPVDDLKSLFIL